MSSLSRRFPRAYRAFVSLFVIGVLGAQVTNVMATILQKSVGGPWYWPIIDYPMYAMAGYEGESVDSEYRIFVVLDDGRTRAVSRDELGLNVFHFRFLTNDVTQRQSLDSVRPILATVADADRIREVVLTTSGQVITRDGVAQQAPQELARVAVVAERTGP